MVPRGIAVVLGILVFQATASVQCQKLHELLTDAEFSKLFRTNRDNVPEYEVVPIMHDLYKRSSANLRMQFSAFGRNVDIDLNPSDGLLAGENTPVWLASPGRNGEVNYKKLSSNIIGSVAKSFVAPRSLASFVVDKSTKHKPRFQGTFDDLTVVALPVRLQDAVEEELKRLKREIPSTNRTLTPTDYHVIIKSKASSRNRIALVKQVDEIVQRFNETDGHRLKRFAKDIIYPSILIVTDYSGTQRTTQDESKFYDEIRYQLAFWNSVDLRYRDLESPKVRLRIAGIVIGQGRSATPYIYNFLNGEAFDLYQSIKDMPKYWYKQTTNPDFQSDAYNIIMTLTDAKMFDPDTQRIDTAGIAYRASLCVGLASDKFTAVGIVTDNMKFEGINTATHELGHVLGAAHDTDDAGVCSESLGYIMSPKKLRTLKMHHWSPCSLRTIEHFLRQDKHCTDQPAEFHSPGNPIERIAPGDILTDQQQCEAHGYSYTCPPEPKMCEKLQCSIGVINGKDYKWMCRDAPVGALDGTPCAPDAICVRGECRMAHQIIQ